MADRPAAGAAKVPGGQARRKTRHETPGPDSGPGGDRGDPRGLRPQVRLLVEVPAIPTAS